MIKYYHVSLLLALGILSWFGYIQESQPDYGSGIEVNKDSRILSSSFEMQLLKDGEIAYDFSKSELDAYNKIDLNITYRQDFSNEATSGYISLDISAVQFSADSSSNITAGLYLTYGNHILEERIYSVASSPTDTSDTFHPRVNFNSDGQLKDLNTKNGTVTIESFTPDNLNGSFELYFTDNSEFDLLSGTFVKSFSAE